MMDAGLQELAAGRQQDSSGDSPQEAMRFQIKTLSAAADSAWGAFVIVAQVVTQCLTTSCCNRRPAELCLQMVEIFSRLKR